MKTAQELKKYCEDHNKRILIQNNRVYGFVRE